MLASDLKKGVNLIEFEGPSESDNLNLIDWVLLDELPSGHPMMSDDNQMVLNGRINANCIEKHPAA